MDILDKNNYRNCWEFWNCSNESKEECDAYNLKLGRNCWSISARYCLRNLAKISKKKINTCLKCLWYANLNN